MEKGLIAFERAQAGEVQREELPQSALEYLQAIYKNPMLPDHVRMRAATIAIQYESPRLQATAILRDENAFAAQLERALARSAKVIELKRIDDAEEEKSPDL
jgi:hypothetical protein